MIAKTLLVYNTLNTEEKKDIHEPQMSTNEII